MQEHALGVGEELVIEGGIRLTVVAVEADAVLLDISVPEPSDEAGPEASYGTSISAGEKA